jgi:hypothetical protein
MSRVDSYSRRRDELNFGLTSVAINPNTGKPAGPVIGDQIIKYEASIVKDDLEPKIKAVATFPKKNALKKEKRRAS